MLSNRSLFLIVYLAVAASGWAQPSNLGLPPVQHFPKTEYRAGTQSWQIGQNRQGVIFLANNEGLLVYDGVLWDLHPISNKTCLRSLLVAPEGRVYVGGQGELGYFYPDAAGRLEYRSLLALIDPTQRNFADVWDIVFFQNRYFFRTSDRVFCYDPSKASMSVVHTGASLELLEVVQGLLLLHDAQKGILQFDGRQFGSWNGAHPPGLVSALLPWVGDTILVATLKYGLFSLAGGQLRPWTTSCDAFFKEKRIYSAAVLDGQKLALGTNLGGLVVLDASRRPLLWLHKGAGLQNNNVLSLYPDRAGNLWLGLDNGVDYVEINAPFYRILPDGDLEGTGYIARVFDGRLYLGTSNGLYQMPWQPYYDPFDRRSFQLVPGSTGQVWGLDVIGGALLLGHHEGAFRVQPGGLQALGSRTGTWKFVRLNDSLLLAGQYDGLSAFRPVGRGHWQWQGKLAGLEESCRILVPEGDSCLWVSHPYRGVYRVGFRPGAPAREIRLFGRAAGLPSDLFNYIFQVGGRPLVAGEQNVFRYDPASDRFSGAAEFEPYFGRGLRTRYLREDGRGNIWFVHGEQTGVLWVRDEGLGKSVRAQLFPQLNSQMVGGFEHIYPFDSNNVFFGVEKGFMHLSINRLEHVDTALELHICRVQLPQSGDSLLFGGFGGQGEAPELAYANGSLRLVFAAAAYGESRHIEYSSWLEGLEKEWSVWSAKTERDLSHLPPGRYKFWVKARDEQGRESAPAVFEWRVLPPWYASPLALVVYGLLALAGLVALARGQRRRFEREKAALTEQHLQKEAAQRQRAEKSEQALVHLQNEKLEAEIRHKNQELALATMHLVQKGEMMAGVQEGLERLLQPGISPENLQKDVKRLLRLLQMDERTDQDWEQFALHFDEVHGDFLKRLREKYAQLSPNDYRLCAYLRMNLNTKEIAHLMNISVRGVEGSRYRLRRKLNLNNEENLVDFLLQI
ncbi:MAG: hypothetical protein JNK89_06445 [Saprospiraceae bacterium]|nr:hypothetical protein [Saprospiraceae bacterium]